MSLSAVITPAVLDKVIGDLASLILHAASGDLRVARQAAGRLLAAYKAETEAELRLAADIVRFACQALDALDRSRVPGLPGQQVRTLRACAAGLSRRSREARHRLDQRRRDREPVIMPAGSPTADATVLREAAGLIASARHALADTPAPALDGTGNNGSPVWIGAGLRHQAARRIAATFVHDSTRLARRAALARAGQDGDAAEPRGSSCPMAVSV